MTRYMHIPLGSGFVTVAIGVDLGDGTRKLGLAFCSPNDQFSRKRGRLIAEGRMASANSLLLPPGDQPLKARARERIKFALASHQVGPKWARKTTVSI